MLIHAVVHYVATFFGARVAPDSDAQGKPCDASPFCSILHEFWAKPYLY